MNIEVAEQFFHAIETAGIDNYEVITDTAYTHYYHNNNSILKYKDGKILGIKREARSGSPAYGDSQVTVFTSDAEHVCEARLGGSIDQIRDFITAYGFSLDDDENKILVNLNYTNSRIIPRTGDYYKFTEIPQEEYDALSDEDKAKYDKAKLDYEINHPPVQGFVGQVN